MTTPAITGWYLYGIVPAGAEIPEGLTGVGAPAAEPVAVRHDGIAAVVSRIAQGRALGSRRDLLGHARVLDGLAQTMPVVPARFGTVFPEHEAVIAQVLAPRYDALGYALERLAGRYQLTVTVHYGQEVALREVLAEDPAVAQMREVVIGGGGHDARLRLGELVAAALSRKRAEDERQVHASLDRYAVVWRDRPPGADDEAASVAYLIEHERRADFERAAEELAARWSGRARVRLVGPVAAYDFADSLLDRTAAPA